MHGINVISDFKSSRELLEKLGYYGINESFKEGEAILKENAYIKAIPIVTSGRIRVITDR